jgi:hypothetical protein
VNHARIGDILVLKVVDFLMPIVMLSLGSHRVSQAITLLNSADTTTSLMTSSMW